MHFPESEFKFLIVKISCFEQQCIEEQIQILIRIDLSLVFMYGNDHPQRINLKKSDFLSFTRSQKGKGDGL